ncbi:MAG TPA: hypothetical protein PLP13_06475, partial [bacterium]|nr:hypothetical protein [bacterium]
MKTRVYVFLVLGLLMNCTCFCESDGKPGTGSTSREIEIPVPAGNCEITAMMKAGTQRPGISIILLFDDGKKTIINTQSGGSSEQTDAYIEFPEMKIRYYIRPNINFYQTGNRKDELVKNWENLPSASSYFFPFTIKKVNNLKIEFWINGNYAGFNEMKTQLKKVVFKTNGDAEIKDYRCQTNPGDSRFLVLDITTHSNPGIMKDVKIPISDGMNYIEGIPFLVKGGSNFDLGMVKNYARAGYEIDQYLSRSPFDGLPEFLHYSVGLDQYIRAYILCACEDNEKKDRVLTARLTRYVIGGRGDAIADTTVILPKGNEKINGNIKKIGVVTYKDENGRDKKVPLFFVEVFLKVGEIQVLIYDMGGSYFRGILPQPWYLDFEILGKTGSLTAQWDYSHKPANESISGIHIFGVTLEKTPVMMKILPSQVGNVYEKGEKPEMLASLSAKKQGEYLLKWDIFDIDGNAVYQGKQKVVFEDVKTETLFVPLRVKENGWYRIKISLLDRQNRLLIEHPASFAILAEDKRQYGYESPFGTWWFGGAHFGTSDANIVGPLLLKAGLRHSVFSQAWHGKLTEKELSQWKVTSFQVPWNWSMKEEIEKQAKNYENHVKEYLEKWPNCKYALIFHESYGGDTIPPELYGETPKNTDEKKNKEIEKLMMIASSATRVLREKFPDVKIVFGNCNSVSDLVAEFFRRGYPVENIDYFGIESAGQTWMPEKPIEYGTQAAWFVRETGRKFGYNIPVTSCYEWIYRQDRILGEKSQAERYVRDALIGLAYRFPTISIALLYDVGNCYYNTLWGASGLLKRYPLLYPKPSYVAMSTLTRVLDRAEFLRRVRTSSDTVYALEFKKGQDYVYVVWTPRGRCEVDLQFENEGSISIEDIFGRNKPFSLNKRTLKFVAGTDVTYIVSSVPVKEIVSGKRIFDQSNESRKATIVNRMDSILEWELIREKDTRLEKPVRTHTPLRTL